MWYAATMNKTTDIFRLCDHVRETAFALHCYHRHGHLEKIYEHGLVSGDGANPATCGHLKPGHRGGIGGWYLVE